MPENIGVDATAEDGEGKRLATTKSADHDRPELQGSSSIEAMVFWNDLCQVKN